jgi:hypothetical protein
MVSLLALLVELLASFVELIVLTVSTLLFTDPLGAVSFLMGAALFAGTFGFATYLAIGAVLDLFGLALPTPGRTSTRGGSDRSRS